MDLVLKVAWYWLPPFLHYHPFRSADFVLDAAEPAWLILENVLVGSY